MGSLFRSEEMTLAQLFLQSEASYACVRELGELGKVQFRDLNPDMSAFQRKFINEVRRCDEMERKLRFLANEVEKAEIEPRPAGNVEAPDPQDMIDLEAKFEVLEAEVKEINSNKETLKRNLLDLIELQHILSKTQVFFEEAEYTMMAPPTPVIGGVAAPPTSGSDDEKGLLDSELEAAAGAAPASASSQTKFTFVTGVISRERVPAFERVLWRACRGNVFLRQAEIFEALEDPTTGQLEYKVVFILFFQGDQLRTRVRKICEGFRATLYQCPETALERDEMQAAVTNRISDLQSVLHTTQQHSVTQLTDVAQDIDIWQTKVKKIKSIYHTMNMFNLDVTQRCLIAECWCPVEDLDEIQRALTRGTERSGSTVPSILNRMKSDDAPPTYNKVNKFTRGFQNIVDAYGVATYQEVNPTLYTIITFPFLFAVMFGDAGHGLIMMLFALALILFEKRLANFKGGGEMFGTFYNGRYIVFLMGLFSIYTGLIYNDIFAKSINIFGSSWNAAFTEVGLNPDVGDNPALCCPPNGTDILNCVILGTGQGHISLFPREAIISDRRPYPFGLDPIWNVAENKLVFTNSYKMKMAVILGVLQMLFGVLLGIFNHIHFKKYANIVLETVPQILFLMCIFGWLVFLLFYKWCYHYDEPNHAPSLLITLINMFLEFAKSPSVDPDADYQDNEYSVFSASPGAADAQKYFQTFLVILAVICIPWMLLIKPFYLLIKHKRRVKRLQSGGYDRTICVTSDGEDADAEEREGIIKHEEEGGGASAVGSQEERPQEQFEFAEVMIHQSIHTIEYCLGTISNTASYLRLWALSLAHAELSEVLWNMVLRMGVNLSVKTGAGSGVAMGAALGTILIFFLFAFWAVLTVGILLIMEGLSAFLHALRLHWVEFQNKFYEGDGKRFFPFSFEAILRGDDDI